MYVPVDRILISIFPDLTILQKYLTGLLLELRMGRQLSVAWKVLMTNSITARVRCYSKLADITVHAVRRTKACPDQR